MCTFNFVYILCKCVATCVIVNYVGLKQIYISGFLGYLLGFYYLDTKIEPFRIVTNYFKQFWKEFHTLNKLFKFKFLTNMVKRCMCDKITHMYVFESTCMYLCTYIRSYNVQYFILYTYVHAVMNQ